MWVNHKEYHNEIDIEDTENQQGSTEGNDLLHHPTDSIIDNTENDREDPHTDNEDEPVTHETRIRPIQSNQSIGHQAHPKPRGKKRQLGYNNRAENLGNQQTVLPS